MEDQEIMPNWLYQRAKLTPNRTALKAINKEWTFFELDHFARKSALNLIEIGVKAGDRVALLADNSFSLIQVIHALEYVGATLVLLNTRLTTYELAWQIENSEASTIIYDSNFRVTLKGILEQHPNILSVKLSDLTTIETESKHENTLKTEVSLHNLHTIIYTSGTTGKPKGVKLTYGNHWWSAIGSALNLGFLPTDKWLAIVPFFHVSGLSILMKSVIYGIQVTLCEEFIPEKVNETIYNEGITHVSVVTAMLTRMIDSLETGYPGSLRCVLLGGGSVPKTLLEKSRQFNIPVYQTYGMTETASQIVTLAPEYMISKMGSAGKPLFPAEIRIIKNDKEQHAGNEGEIVVKGPNVTKGYFQNEEATNIVIKDGWLYTGDIGYLDKDGFLFVLDRRNDLIISGGENIYPAEIESVLLEHSAIEEAGVTARPDDKWGQVPVGFVKLKVEEAVSEKELINFCAERLAKYKVPVAIYFVKELPRNASKKLLRRKLLNLI